MGNDMYKRLSLLLIRKQKRFDFGREEKNYFFFEK